MKLEKNLIIENDSIGDFKEVKASISDENIALVIELASKDLYSNPIGSIIREITSNCFDANKESGSENPILIEIYTDYEDDTKYITFKDNGLGISPERMEDIYMKWFSSTKRSNNIEIGGFGIGSKSPLSYQNQFFITTIQDNIKYEYILSKTDTVPSLTLLNSFNTQEHSGTTIKVEVLEKDLFTFHQEFKRQLSYFEKVHIKSYYVYNNDFKLYKNEHFIYKDSEQPYESMHIALGQVTYKIDWQALNRKEIKCPIGIRFNIGDLTVSMNRETIRYNEETIEKINKKIDLVLGELKKIYDKQDNKIYDLIEYINKKDTTLDIIIAEGVTLSSESLGLDNKYQYGYDVKIPDNILELFQITKIENGNVRQQNWHKESLVLSSRVTFADKGTNIYDNFIFHNGYILKRKTFTWYELLNKLGYSNRLPVYPKKQYTEDRVEIDQSIIEFEDTKFYYNLYKINKEGYHTQNIRGIELYKSIKHIVNYFRSIAVQYYKADEEYIKEYRLLNRERNLAYQRRLEKKVIVYDLNNKRKEVKIEDLTKDYFVLYKIRGEKYNLDDYDTILRKFSLYKKRCRIIGISQTTLKQLKDYTSNFYHIKDIHKIESFKNFLGEFTFYKEIKYSNYSNLRGLSDYYDKIINRLDEFKKKFSNIYISLDLTPEVNYDNHIVYILRKQIEELDEFSKKVEVLKYINYDCPTKYLPFIAKLCKTTKLKNKYYNGTD